MKHKSISKRHYIVTEKPDLVRISSEDDVALTPEAFINSMDFLLRENRKIRVINLCKNYEYLSKGYYCSLLAEARGLQCVPNVANIIALEWKRNYEFALPELNALLEKTFKEDGEEPLSRTYTSFFGRHNHPGIEPVARRIFDLFRFPILSFEIKYVQPGKWVVDSIDTPSFTGLVERQIEQFHNSLDKFTGSAWRMKSHKKQERYWIGILHDPNEAHPPSNKAALNKFIAAGKKMGLWVELITRNDFSTLLEYDALFIRETTAINNHTYRFASKAEQEDIPCIDDTTSIIRCCNKVYLKEVLGAHKVPMPKTLILDKKTLSELDETLEFPAVLKIPDGAFSRGISKVENLAALKREAATLFQKSDILLLQEFLHSQYDWRIGMLGGKPVYAIKYYMAEGHWQIYNHSAKSKKGRAGAHECVPLTDVPGRVIRTAEAATKWIGNGLYGVDLKQLEDGRVVVIEVNDNPSIDHGVEDEILGDALYEKILSHLVKMIEM